MGGRQVGKRQNVDIIRVGEMEGEEKIGGKKEVMEGQRKKWQGVKM